MRAIAGGLLTVAGALLWGAGALALTLAPWTRSSTDAGTLATFAGAALVLLGICVLANGLLSERPPSRGA